MKTEAAILVEPGRPLALVELGVPPLQPGQVLVEVAFSGLCGTQLLEVRGHRGTDPWLPHALGLEGTGIVLETGAGVTLVAPGDRVVMSWIRGPGIEAGGARYDWEGRPVNAGGVTTFQRHSVVSENRLTRLPGGLPMDLAVLLGCATPTGMGAVLNTGRLRRGESVAVFGTGGVGLNACAAAVIGGAATVVAVDPDPGRRAMAARLGAGHVVDPATCDAVAAIRAILPAGVDLAIEATGLPEVMQQALAATRPRGGRAVLVGNARHGRLLTLDPAAFNQGRSLLGTWGGDCQPATDFPRFAGMLASARFPFASLLSTPYRLAAINQALDDLASARSGRPVIAMALR